MNLPSTADREGRGYHVDTLDVYAARSRAVYIKQASVELGLADETIKRDLGQVLFTTRNPAR